LATPHRKAMAASAIFYHIQRISAKSDCGPALQIVNSWARLSPITFHSEDGFSSDVS